MEFISKTEKQTIDFAKEYAKSLKIGDVVLLNGDLGAGKTVFTKGLAKAYSKTNQNVVSPTFTILNEYNTNPKIYHFDFYRIKSEDELIAIGIEEYLYGDGICVIEWPERAPNILAGIKVKNIQIIKDDNNRIIKY